MSDEITTAITEATSTPASFTNDGRTITQRPIADLIAADKHVAAKTAGALGFSGVLKQIITPPSALG